jgi:tRNA 2-thiouridine synthesizing protein C
VKKILFILRKPPHSGAYIQEVLDIVMTTTAFDQEVSLLLMDNSVFQLKKHQKLEGTGLKDTAAIFKALPVYNITAIYTETESLLENGLTADSLSEPVTEISRANIGEFLKKFDLVLST